MKRKIISLLLLSVMPFLLLCGCGTKVDNYTENVSERFVIIEKIQDNFYDLHGNWCDICIVVDRETKIKYLFLFYGHRCSIETMFNVDGTPMLYEGEL